MGVLFWLTRTHTGLQYVSIASVFLPFYRGKKLTVFATIVIATISLTKVVALMILNNSIYGKAF